MPNFPAPQNNFPAPQNNFPAPELQTLPNFPAPQNNFPTPELNDIGVVCRGGEYAKNGECVGCPGFNTVSREGSLDIYDCVGCPTGSLMNNTKTKCVACPEGTTSPYNGSGNCSVKCPNGTTIKQYDIKSVTNLQPTGETGERTVCTCSVGELMNSRGICVCDASKGFAKDPDFTDKCIQCLPQDAKQIIEGVCKDIQCGPGQYANRAGSCVTCPSNTPVRSRTSKPKVENCVGCPAGQQPNLDFSACEKCPENTVKSYAGFNEKCKPCPPGTRADQSNIKCVPITCVGGKYLNSTTGQCKPCPTYRPVRGGETQSINACTGCPVGQEPNNDYSGCVDCPVNTFKEWDPAGKCKPCPEGKSTNGATRSLVCTTNNQPTCMHGKFLNNGMCVLCPRRTPVRNENDPKADQSACKGCPAGYQAKGDRSGCERCPVNTYKGYAGWTAQCRNCKYGTDGKTGSTTCRRKNTRRSLPWWMRWRF